jgi:flagellar motility protein MotE (MotC chaperone)
MTMVPTAAKRSWYLRVPLLPIAAAGLFGLLPWLGADVVQRWQAAFPPGPPPVPTAPISAPAAEAPVILPSGAIAQPVLVATLAETERASPLSDDRVADSRLLTEVGRRNLELDRREHDLRMREANVAAAEQLTRGQIAELSRMRQTIEGLLVHETRASEEDMSLLVGLYSNMKPAQAATVLGKLDAPKAALILQRLDTRMAGPILAAMDTASAVAITEEVEQRRAAFRP